MPSLEADLLLQQKLRQQQKRQPEAPMVSEEMESR